MLNNILGEAVSTARFSNAEIGVFLRAVGQQMYERDMDFATALKHFHSLNTIREDIVGMLDSLDPDEVLSVHDLRQRAELLLRLTVTVAFNFPVLYYVCWDDVDGNKRDLLIEADSPESATTMWRTHYEVGLDVNPKWVGQVNLKHAPGPIGWETIIPPGIE